MLFPGMSEYQFATFFVVVKQEQIKQDLQIKYLCMNMVIQTVYNFVLKSRVFIQTKYQNQYASLDDKKFYFEIIKVLKKAKKQGTPLENTICCL